MRAAAVAFMLVVLSVSVVAQSVSVPGSDGKIILAPVPPPPTNPGDRVTISPGQIGQPPNPGAHNPHQASPPQAPGIVVTIPTR